MTSNINAPWINRLGYATNDLIVRPALEMKKELDHSLLKVLTPNQLELVYAILTALPIAVTCLMLPTGSGILLFGAMYLTEFLKPDLLSKKNWTILHMSAGLFFLGSAPSIFLLAYKVDSVILFGIGLVRAGLGAVIVWDAIEDHGCAKREYSSRRPIIPREIDTDWHSTSEFHESGMPDAMPFVPPTYSSV